MKRRRVWALLVAGVVLLVVGASFLLCDQPRRVAIVLYVWSSVTEAVYEVWEILSLILAVLSELIR